MNNKDCKCGACCPELTEPECHCLNGGEIQCPWCKEMELNATEREQSGESDHESRQMLPIGNSKRCERMKKQYKVDFMIGDKARAVDSKMIGTVTSITINSAHHIQYRLETFDGDALKDWWLVGWQLEAASDDDKLGFKETV